jgi:asparagine synthetase B (glutamine-hydrolysing)
VSTVGYTPYLTHVPTGTGNALLWNGEVFGCDELIAKYMRILPGQSDTAQVSLFLRNVCERCAGATGVAGGLTTALSHIHGPYSFIYYHRASNSLHFGRDPFGRRSLLLRCPQITTATSTTSNHTEKLLQACHDACRRGMFALTSVAPSGPVEVESDSNTAEDAAKWLEIDIAGVYTMANVFRTEAHQAHRCFNTPWPIDRVRLARGLRTIVSTTVTSSDRESHKNPEELFLCALQDAVARRVRSIVNQATIDTAAITTGHAPGHGGVAQVAASKVGVLFSGGIDSVLLTALLHHSLAPTVAVDLLNVTFLKGSSGTTNGIEGSGDPISAAEHGKGIRILRDPTPSPDRVAAIAAHQELQVEYIPSLHTTHMVYIQFRCYM